MSILTEDNKITEIGKKNIVQNENSFSPPDLSSKLNVSIQEENHSSKQLLQVEEKSTLQLDFENAIWNICDTEIKKKSSGFKRKERKEGEKYQQQREKYSKSAFLKQKTAHTKDLEIIRLILLNQQTDIKTIHAIWEKCRQEAETSNLIERTVFSGILEPSLKLLSTIENYPNNESKIKEKICNYIQKAMLLQKEESISARNEKGIILSKKRFSSKFERLKVDNLEAQKKRNSLPESQANQVDIAIRNTEYPQKIPKITQEKEFSDTLENLKGNEDVEESQYKIETIEKQIQTFGRDFGEILWKKFWKNGFVMGVNITKCRTELERELINNKIEDPMQFSRIKWVLAILDAWEMKYLKTSDEGHDATSAIYAELLRINSSQNKKEQNSLQNTLLWEQTSLVVKERLPGWKQNDEQKLSKALDQYEKLLKDANAKQAIDKEEFITIKTIIEAHIGHTYYLLSKGDNKQRNEYIEKAKSLLEKAEKFLESGSSFNEIGTLSQPYRDTLILNWISRLYLALNENNKADQWINKTKEKIVHNIKNNQSIIAPTLPENLCLRAKLEKANQNKEKAFEQFFAAQGAGTMFGLQKEDPQQKDVIFELEKYDKEWLKLAKNQQKNKFAFENDKNSKFFQLLKSYGAGSLLGLNEENPDIEEIELQLSKIKIDL